MTERQRALPLNRSNQMSKYFFHVINGKAVVDDQGVELADMDAMCSEAARSAGEMIASGDQTWNGEAWHDGRHGRRCEHRVRAAVLNRSAWRVGCQHSRPYLSVRTGRTPAVRSGAAGGIRAPNSPRRIVLLSAPRRRRGDSCALELVGGRRATLAKRSTDFDLCFWPLRIDFFE